MAFANIGALIYQCVPADSKKRKEDIEAVLKEMVVDSATNDTASVARTERSNDTLIDSLHGRDKKVYTAVSDESLASRSDESFRNESFASRRSDESFRTVSQGPIPEASTASNR
jgi:hypothetical protein